MGQKVRQAISTPALRAIIASHERELPDTDTDRYERAYERGRVQARSIYLGLGLAAGVTAGVVAALLLDPKHGKARRDAIAGKAGSVTRDLSGRTKVVSDRVKGIAAERGIIKPGPESEAAAEQVEAAADHAEEALATLAEATPDAALEPMASLAEPVTEPKPSGA
jgi:gas vesicle protein